MDHLIPVERQRVCHQACNKVRVARVVVTLALLVTVAIRCAASPHEDMAAATDSPRPARLSLPEPRGPHDSIHRVIELWLDKKDHEAQKLIETALERRPMDPETQVALHDLAARLLWLEAHQRIGSQRIETLELAEYRAALAASAAPMSLSLWRDYLSIAIEARGRKRVDLKLDGVWKYGAQGQDLHIFLTDEQRIIGRATLQVIDGRHRTAITQLRTFLSSQRRENCAARAVLSQILHDVGQLDTAIRTISDASDACRQNSFVARFESTLVEAQEARAEEAESSAFTQAGLRTTMTVYGDRPFDHRTDLENLILQDPARLDRWFVLWKLLHEDDRGAREFQKVIHLARRIRPSLEIDVADVHGQVGRGEFRKALETTNKLLAERPDDRLIPTVRLIHAVRLLCGAALGGGKPAYSRDLDIVDREATISSSLRLEQVEYCLGQDPRCVRGAMVRRRPTQFSAAAYSRGWALYSPPDLPKYVDWSRDEEAAERLDGMSRLRAEMQARDTQRKEQLNALQARLVVILQPKIEQLEARVTDGEMKHAQYEQEMNRARVQTNAELNQLADRVEKKMAIMDRESVLAREEVRALSLRVAANYKALMAIDVDRFADLFEQYIQTRPREATIVHFNIINQLQSAKGSDTDVAVILPTIMDECTRLPAPSPSCLRTVLKMVKKHVNLDAPLIPGVLSLDLLGVEDTLLELLDYLTRKLLLVPKSAEFGVTPTDHQLLPAVIVRTCGFEAT
jgi:hypothetical protein